MSVTKRLNSDMFTGKNLRSLKPGTIFSILVLEEKIKEPGASLTECEEPYFLVQTPIEPTTENVAQLTAGIEQADQVNESDITADFSELQELMPTVQRDSSYLFLLRFKTMVKEVSPIVQSPPGLPPKF